MLAWMQKWIQIIKALIKYIYPNCVASRQIIWSLTRRQCGPVVRAVALRSRISWVQDPLWPLAEFVPGSPWFNLDPAALVNSQLACLRPVAILNSCCSVLSFRSVSLTLKSPYGEWSIEYTCMYNLYWSHDHGCGMITSYLGLLLYKS